MSDNGTKSAIPPMVQEYLGRIGRYHNPDLFMLPNGQMPPLLSDFEHETRFATSVTRAVENLHDEESLRARLRELFRPDLSAEFDPLKYGNFTTPEQRKALGNALELFAWEYKSYSCNRLALAQLMADQARVVVEAFPKISSAQFDIAMDLATLVVETQRGEGNVAFQTVDSTWPRDTGLMNQYDSLLSGLSPGPRSLFHLRKCWIEIRDSIPPDGDFIDHGTVRSMWASGDFQIDELLGLMPWSYQIAHRMMLDSHFEDSWWFPLIVEVLSSDAGVDPQGN